MRCGRTPLFVPPRLAHAFANRTDTPAKFLLIMSPPGHDRYFDDLAEILATDGPPDSDKIAELRRRYDTKSDLVARRWPGIARECPSCNADRKPSYRRQDE